MSWELAIPTLTVLLSAVFAAGGAWLLLRLVWVSNKGLGERVGKLEQWKAAHMERHQVERELRRELTGRHAVPEPIGGAGGEDGDGGR
jgi:hypothetical protein